jgi:asparagine synthase (glutamine-hydrolysing)
MNSDPFQHYDHLGFFNPYYFKTQIGEIIINNNFSNLITRFDSQLAIDPIAIIEVLNNRFMLGDRTIIQNMYKSPWMARYNMQSFQWNFADTPTHREKCEKEELIAEGLFKLLCEEIIGYIGQAKQIGILLSGGMDSRMVAGVLDYLIKTRQLEIGKVTAYTWGNDGCRDVVYAEVITKRLNWLWKHYTVSSSDLWENFKVAGHRGCEYSGIHLHAIPQIQKDINDEVLLVGSYGDGIGRAEYQGVHVHRLTPINKGFKNFGNLIKHREYKKLKNLWNEDIYQYHKRYTDSKSYQKNELDYQLHYMRRMLNPCIELLNEVVPTYQVFTCPSVYQFMWSFDVKQRNDSIYMHMMKLFRTSLDDIPWARTGLPFGTFRGQPDKYLESHHSYSHFIQNNLIDKIESKVLSDRIKNLNLFNPDAIKVLIKLVRNFPNNNIDYLERITWLVSLDFFLEKFENVKVEVDEKASIDYFKASLLTPLRYLLLQIYRQIIYKSIPN